MIKEIKRKIKKERKKEKRWQNIILKKERNELKMRMKKKERDEIRRKSLRRKTVTKYPCGE